MRSVASQAAAISPALLFQLMAGYLPEARLRGWVQLAQADAAAIDAAWQQHGAAITAAAVPYGFQPFAATRRVPSGPGFALWRDRFLAQHRY